MARRGSCWRERCSCAAPTREEIEEHGTSPTELGAVRAFEVVVGQTRMLERFVTRMCFPQWR